MCAELRAIERTVHAYLDGLYEGDTDKLEMVFHPTSALTQYFDGERRVTPRDGWFAAVRTRPSPKSQGLERADRVLTIDIVGPAMAFVKLKCAIPGCALTGADARRPAAARTCDHRPANRCSDPPGGNPASPLARLAR